MKRPQRWDHPFGHTRLPAKFIDAVLETPAFRDIDPANFPDDLALGDIIANDARILRLKRGKVIYREGEYGTSIYMVLHGAVRRLPPRKREKRAIGPAPANGKSGLGQLLSLPWRNSTHNGNGADGDTAFPKTYYGPFEIFGEVEALARGARNTSLAADADGTLLLEIRLPGLRELCHWSDALRERIDGLYRRRSLEIGLCESPLFAHLDWTSLAHISRDCVLETHGALDWTHRYQRETAEYPGPAQVAKLEPIILDQGHYLDDLLLIRSGFARITHKLDHGERTLGHLSRGDVFGLTEIVESVYGASLQRARCCLRAIGYADVIRVPVHIVKQFVVPSLPLGELQDAATISTPPAKVQSLLDFSVDKRFVNGTAAMAIDTTRCVNCDDCVRACASTHNNVPRFVREGPTHNSLMVAHACMHCVDPVCLADCPTGAIHREHSSGSVIIDEKTCIGCATCASACPYDNIRMEKIRNADGAFQIDDEGAHILRAVKCDLCEGQSGGPACQRACPHDALIRIDVGNLTKLSDWLDYAQ